MNSSVHLLKSELFFNSELQLFVNRCTEDFNLPFHAHDFLEYSYVAEGAGFHHIAQDIVPVQKGMLFVIPVGVPHVFRPSSSNVSEHPLIIYNCLFHTELIHKLSLTIQEEDIRSHLIDLANNEVSYISIGDQNRQIEELLVKLYRETSVAGIGSSSMLFTLVCQLIVTTYRQLHQKRQGEHGPSSDFEYILQYLDQHLGMRIRMSDLSHQSGWSEKQIGRMFLSYTGQTFSSYLQHLRIQKSRELLKSSQHKVSLIAELVGYRDVDTFYTVFKRITGETPLTYRKRSRT